MCSWRGTLATVLFFLLLLLVCVQGSWTPRVREPHHQTTRLVLREHSLVGVGPMSRAVGTNRGNEQSPAVREARFADSGAFLVFVHGNHGGHSGSANHSNGGLHGGALQPRHCEPSHRAFVPPLFPWPFPFPFSPYPPPFSSFDHPGFPLSPYGSSRSLKRP